MAYSTTRTPFAGAPASLDATYRLVVVSQTKVLPSDPGGNRAAAMRWERGAASGIRTLKGNACHRPSGGRAGGLAGVIGTLSGAKKYGASSVKLRKISVAAGAATELSWVAVRAASASLGGVAGLVLPPHAASSRERPDRYANRGRREARGIVASGVGRRAEAARLRPGGARAARACECGGEATPALSARRGGRVKREAESRERRARPRLTRALKGRLGARRALRGRDIGASFRTRVGPSRRFSARIGRRRDDHRFVVRRFNARIGRRRGDGDARADQPTARRGRGARRPPHAGRYKDRQGPGEPREGTAWRCR